MYNRTAEKITVSRKTTEKNRLLAAENMCASRKFFSQLRLIVLFNLLACWRVVLVHVLALTVITQDCQSFATQIC